MNKQLTSDELKNLLVPMTRREKLLRLATIIREARSLFGFRRSFYIFHNLEYMNPETLGSQSHPSSVFELASIDPMFRQAGLSGRTIGDAMKFFELSRADLHTFSCDCGGSISCAEMARNIERLAA